MPDNNMGNAENIVNKNFEAAGKASSMTREQAMEEAYNLLAMVLGKTPSHVEKDGEYDTYVKNA